MTRHENSPGKKSWKTWQKPKNSHAYYNSGMRTRQEKKPENSHKLLLYIIISSTPSSSVKKGEKCSMLMYINMCNLKC